MPDDVTLTFILSTRLLLFTLLAVYRSIAFGSSELHPTSLLGGFASGASQDPAPVSWQLVLVFSAFFIIVLPLIFSAPTPLHNRPGC